MNYTKILRDTPPPQLPDPTAAAIQDVARALERINETLAEGIRAFLKAKFPHGKPDDRWSRS